MAIVFKQINSNNLQQAHDLILKGWLFAYSHISKTELKKLVDKYFSEKKLAAYLKLACKGKAFFFGAFDGAELVGVCIAKLVGKKAELASLYVEPKKLRAGIGSELINLLEKFLVENGVFTYFTFANKHNKIGINFYKKAGFVRAPEKDKDDEFEKKALVYLEKKL